LSVASLYPPVAITIDLYVEHDRRCLPRLYSSAATPPTAADLDRLSASGVTTLYAPPEQVAEFRRYLRELAASSVDMAAGVRFDIAREAVKDDFSRAWRDREPGALVDRAADFSRQVVEVCRSRDEMLSALASLAGHDGDTFAHISNVCTYSILLAQRAGESDERRLIEIGQAALLHDIGKRAIRPEILRKPGRLTPDETDRIREHPRIGFEELCRLPHLSREQLLVVYQHHERVDGTGYPVGLAGDELSEQARLCSVVDVFDALTARRSYRRPATADEALEIIQAGAGTQFSEELVRCWTDVVQSAAEAV
jgi:HD-GYP domain-containing protein (c-di-GMP phosphodiesterase class II)